MSYKAKWNEWSHDLAWRHCAVERCPAAAQTSLKDDDLAPLCVFHARKLGGDNAAQERARYRSGCGAMAVVQACYDEEFSISDYHLPGESLVFRSPEPSIEHDERLCAEAIRPVNGKRPDLPQFRPEPFRFAWEDSHEGSFSGLRTTTHYWESVSGGTPNFNRDPEYRRLIGWHTGQAREHKPTPANRMATAEASRRRWKAMSKAERAQASERLRRGKVARNTP